jgi:hypothetical protein
VPGPSDTRHVTWEDVEPAGIPACAFECVFVSSSVKVSLEICCTSCRSVSVSLEKWSWCLHDCVYVAGVFGGGVAGSCQCPERPCTVGTFNSDNRMSCSSGGYVLVGGANVYLPAAVGRGGGSECSCTSCSAGETADINVPLFFVSRTFEFVSHTLPRFFLRILLLTFVNLSTLVLIHAGYL